MACPKIGDDHFKSALWTSEQQKAKNDSAMWNFYSSPVNVFLLWILGCNFPAFFPCFGRYNFAICAILFKQKLMLWKLQLSILYNLIDRYLNKMYTPEDKYSMAINPHRDQ